MYFFLKKNLLYNAKNGILRLKSFQLFLLYMLHNMIIVLIVLNNLQEGTCMCYRKVTINHTPKNIIYLVVL